MRRKLLWMVILWLADRAMRLTSSVLLVLIVTFNSCPLAGARGQSESESQTPSRTTYLDLGYRTHSFVNGVGYPGWHISLYDPFERLFFVSVTYGNQVVVVSPESETIIARISVPAPAGMDFSLDGRRLLVATGTDFLYVIDPGRLQVVERMDLSGWGGQGCSMQQPLSLTGGKIGFIGSSPSASGILIWNPGDNSVERVVDEVWSATRSTDGTKIAYASLTSPLKLGIFDVKTRVLHSGQREGVTLACAFRPGKNQFLVVGGPTGKQHAVLYDENMKVILDRDMTAGPHPFECANGFFNRDGSKVFLESHAGSDMAVLDADTFLITGYVQRVDPSCLTRGLLLTQDIDETGLAVGASHQGVVLVDTNNIFSAPRQLPCLICSQNSLVAGPVAGGTPVSYRVMAQYYTPDSGSLDEVSVFFGSVRASTAMASFAYFGMLRIDSVAPANSAGPKHIGVYFPDGTMTMAAYAFSYGPAIRELPVTASTAEGGPAVLYGYGLPQNANVIVGAATSSAISSYPDAVYDPSNSGLRQLAFTIPPGSPGRAALSVQTPDGTANYPNAVRYYPAPEKYPLAGSPLWMGVLDPKHRAIYFTKDNRVEVFSTGSRNWLAPLEIPAAAVPRKIRFAALSPEARYLAVTDVGNKSLIIIDVSTREVLREITLHPIKTSYKDYVGFPLVYASESRVYTLAYDELSLTDITNGFAIRRTEAVSFPEVTPHTKMILDPSGRYLLFDDGTYYDLEKSDYPFSRYSWGCQTSWYGSNFSISADGKLCQGGCVMTPDFRITNQLCYSEAESYSTSGRWGQVWDRSGTYLFQPTASGIDLIDSKTGKIRERITSSLNIPDGNLPLVLDSDNELLFVITTQGIAALDVHSLPICIGSVTPSSGTSGTLVTIRGTGFDQQTLVLLDGTLIKPTFQDSNTLRFTVPKGRGRSAQLRLRAADGSEDSLDGAFTTVLSRQRQRNKRP